MTALNLAENPFRVFTPEDMEATDVAELFVNPPDANKIGGPGHTMLNGARGCGKSMIFRYLLSDCQMITLKKPLNELPFLAFLVSIKNIGATPTLTEFLRLKEKHANLVLNEHVLTIFAAAKVFSSLSHIDLPGNEKAGCEAVDYFEKHFKKRMEQCGSEVKPLPSSSRLSPVGVFEHIADICNDCYSAVVRYAKRFTLGHDLVPYTGALCDYLEFLLPLLNKLKDLSFLPSSPVYLLIDDADYLSRAQTVVLNSWVSTRTQADVSIKVSTQLHYKTFQTMSGLPIQSPHDFQKVDISDLYTTRHGRYLSRVEKIVSKRLIKAGIEQLPRVFFPNDKKQERAIREIGEKIRLNWPKEGRGYRASDDVVRYARPEYIRSLGGKSKSMSTYSYSGFEQLVHISSGLFRYFLESAAVMFDEQRNSPSDQPDSPSDRPVTFITPKIQNQVARHRADQFMLS